MNDLDREDYRRRIGTGGAKKPLEIVTGGRVRFEIPADTPALIGAQAGSDPAAPSSGGVFFWRDNGAGKSQLCVRFPSGATQIIATEP